MKLLLGVLSCWWRDGYTTYQRETWAKPTDGIDIRFFYGRGANRPAREDEIFLDCDDKYHGLPEKVRAMCQWAYEHGYDYVFKVDDDTYVVPSRLLTSGFERFDYVGRYQPPIKQDIYPYGFCSGGPGYWLSRRAMEILKDSPLDDPHHAEDRWVSNTLGKQGIIGVFDSRYKVTILRSDCRQRTNVPLECPRLANNIITVCEFSAEKMFLPHKIWLDSQTKMNDVLDRLKIV